jgi:hypothetical protein
MDKIPKKYINLFKNDKIKDGIRINIKNTEEALDAVKEIFTKKPNIVYSFGEYKIEGYEKIIKEYRNWLITGKYNISLDKKKLTTEIFKFHYNTVQDHVIAFQSYNLDNALLLCRINKKFINIVIPRIDGIPLNTSIVAIYT